MSNIGIEVHDILILLAFLYSKYDVEFNLYPNTCLSRLQIFAKQSNSHISLQIISQNSFLNTKSAPGGYTANAEAAM